MKKISKELRISLLSNIAVVALIFFVVAFTIFPSERAVTTIGSSYEPYYNGNRENKNVALMFNVYQNTEVVEGILDVLASRKAKATFFVGGCWADDNGEVLQRIVGEGHELGNHGYFHKDHKKISYEENKEEIYLTQIITEALCGEKTRLFAPPSGSFSKTTLEVCAELDYKVIMWSKDTIDWRDKDGSLVKKRATENLNNGDLILMHPMAHTLSVLGEILDYYQSIGFKAVTVSECLA